MKRFFFIIAFLLCSLAAAAQGVTFRADGPGVVAVGELFRVELSVNAKPDTPNQLAKAPEIADFEVLAGPSLSYGSSTRIVNGQVSQQTYYTYTYVLRAAAEGHFTIPAAQVVVDGRTYSSQPLPIEVVAESPESQGTSGQQGQQQALPSGQIAPDDIVLSASVNSQNVYKGQPVRLTLKLYTRVPLSGAGSSKLPSMNGFWSQEIALDTRRQWQRETFNGKVYDAQVIGQYLLYPQQSGELRIDPFTLQAIAQVVTQAPRSGSMLDDIFGGGTQVEEVLRELPAGAPASFNGAVGQFKLQSDISSRSIAANASATYTLRISGSGNLPLVQAPRFEPPASFELFSIKTTESLQNSASGTSGYRQFDYPFIARAAGDYTLPAAEFTYFDPAAGRYVTLSSQAISLSITPDEGGGSAGSIVSGLTKEDVRVLGDDIRFIKIGTPGLRSSRRWAIAGGWYWTLFGALTAALVAAYHLLRERIRRRGNAVLMRGRRANHVALQRLKAAERAKKEDDRRAFLEEMLRALWGYLSDKLNIPVANLTKENVREGLLRRGVEQRQVEACIEVISACEAAQYSPERSGQMEALYASGVEAISAMEAALK